MHKFSVDEFECDNALGTFYFQEADALGVGTDIEAMGQILIGNVCFDLACIETSPEEGLEGNLRHLHYCEVGGGARGALAVIHNF